MTVLFDKKFNDIIQVTLVTLLLNILRYRYMIYTHIYAHVIADCSKVGSHGHFSDIIDKDEKSRVTEQK